jgi:hypothetical protein
MFGAGIEARVRHRVRRRGRLCKQHSRPGRPARLHEGRHVVDDLRHAAAFISRIGTEGLILEHNNIRQFACSCIRGGAIGRSSRSIKAVGHDANRNACSRVIERRSGIVPFIDPIHPMLVDPLRCRRPGVEVRGRAGFDGEIALDQFIEAVAQIFRDSASRRPGAAGKERRPERRPFLERGRGRRTRCVYA